MKLKNVMILICKLSRNAKKLSGKFVSRSWKMSGKVKDFFLPILSGNP